MTQLLVPVDPHDAGRTRAAVDRAVRIQREEPAVHIRLLRVQPKLSGHVSMYFGQRELQQLQQSAGAEDLEYAEGLLRAAGADYTATVLVGRGAETIAEAARRFGCDRVIFGEAPAGLAGRMFGSLAQQVRHLLGASHVQVLG
ncbi:universal stress protein [Ramlibacter sp. G-1-2-2]|uniref:Universal stress protein n=1 Tax=Ramlibacter agri TaxID=2728837 RepID=A0A848H055_9BURK|nr:universal stress protein [Ramlibacter agri]NML43954.1 universal stress protein [Ramlibacter agri]